MDLSLFIFNIFILHANVNASFNEKDAQKRQDLIKECSKFSFINLDDNSTMIATSYHLTIPEALPKNTTILVQNLFLQGSSLCNLNELSASKIDGFSIDITLFPDDSKVPVDFKLHTLNEIKPIKRVQEKLHVFLTLLDHLDFDDINRRNYYYHALITVNFYKKDMIEQTIINRAELSIFIRLTDDDDLNPKFEHNMYFAHILEGVNKTTTKQINTSFGEVGKNLFDVQPKIIARDQDSGKNSSVIVKIIDGNKNECFDWDEKLNKLILLKPLYIENSSIIYLQLMVVQNDNQNRYSYASLIVKVHDSNNHKPVIKKPKYELVLQEHTANGTVIGKIDAYDADQGNNGVFLFEIINENPNMTGIIEINPYTGFLIVSNDMLLDREVFQVFQFQVAAKEILTEEKFISEPTTVQILLIDVNDYSPSFESPSYFCEMNPYTKDFYLNNEIMVFDFDSNEDNRKIEFEIIRVFSLKSNIIQKFVLNSTTSNFYLQLDENNKEDNTIPRVVSLLIRASDSSKDEKRADHAIIIIHFNTSFTESKCMQTDNTDFIDILNFAKTNLPRIPASFITDKEQLKSFEALWVTFMSIFVFLLLFALIVLIIRIGAKEKIKYNEDLFILTSPSIPTTNSLNEAKLRRQSSAHVNPTMSDNVMQKISNLKTSVKKFRKNKILDDGTQIREGVESSFNRTATIDLKTVDHTNNQELIKIEADKRMRDFHVIYNNEHSNNWVDQIPELQQQSINFDTSAKSYDIQTTIKPLSPSTPMKFIIQSKPDETKY